MEHLFHTHKNKLQGEKLARKWEQWPHMKPKGEHSESRYFYQSVASKQLLLSTF